MGVLERWECPEHGASPHDGRACERREYPDWQVCGLELVKVEYVRAGGVVDPYLIERLRTLALDAVDRAEATEGGGQDLRARLISVCEALDADHSRGAVEAARHKPTDRPDAHCADCPFADRGDWVMYRDEWEAMRREREAAIEDRKRAREALRAARYFVSKYDPSGNTLAKVDAVLNQREPDDERQDG